MSSDFNPKSAELLTGLNSSGLRSALARSSQKLLSIETRANLFVILNQSFNSAGNFLLTIWLINRLGLGEFGIFALYFMVAQSIATMINALVAAPAISIAGTTKPDTRQQMLMSASVLGTFCLIAVLPIVVVGSALTEYWGLSEVSALGLYALTVTMTATDLIRRLLIFVDKRLALWIFDLGRYGLLAVALAFEAASAGVATPQVFLGIVSASSGILIVLSSLWWSRRIYAMWPPQGLVDHARRLVRVGSWLSISSLMRVVSTNIFYFVGAALLGSHAVGILRACESVVGLINPLMLALENIVPKWLGERIRENGRVRALSSYVRTGAAIVGAFAILLGIVAFFAGPLLSLVAGLEASAYVWVMQIVCAGYLAFVVTTCFSYAYRAQERTQPVALSLTISAVFTAVIAWPMVYYFGLVGLAVGVLAAEIVRLVVLIQQRGLLRLVPEPQR